MKTNIDYKNKAATILKTTREHAGKSQQDMAKLLNHDRSTIISWECGKTFPKLPEVLKWLDYLKVNESIMVSDCNTDILWELRKLAVESVELIDRERKYENEDFET